MATRSRASVVLALTPSPITLVAGEKRKKKGKKKKKREKYNVCLVKGGRNIMVECPQNFMLTDVKSQAQPPTHQKLELSSP